MDCSSALPHRDEGPNLFVLMWLTLSPDLELLKRPLSNLVSSANPLSPHHHSTGVVASYSRTSFVAVFAARRSAFYFLTTYFVDTSCVAFLATATS